MGGELRIPIQDLEHLGRMACVRFCRVPLRRSLHASAGVVILPPADIRVQDWKFRGTTPQEAQVPAGSKSGSSGDFGPRIAKGYGLAGVGFRPPPIALLGVHDLLQ